VRKDRDKFKREKGKSGHIEYWHRKGTTFGCPKHPVLGMGVHQEYIMAG
jgi:hypothetical protein